MIDLTPEEVARFWSKVHVGPGCWLWTKEVNNRGYGRFVIYREGKRTRLMAHRVAYKLVTGTDLGDQLGRHQCDNPPCCNPADLLPGTQVDNMRDARERNRLVTAGLDVGRELNRAVALATVQSGVKFCSGCQSVRPLDEFYRASRQLHGRQSRCKSCERSGKAAAAVGKGGPST